MYKKQYFLVAENMPEIQANLFIHHKYEGEWDVYCSDEFETLKQLIEFGIALERTDRMCAEITKEQYDELKTHVNI